MNNLAKEINLLLHEDVIIKEYLQLKKEIEEDSELIKLKNQLDSLRKDICKNKDRDSEEYFILLDKYNSDSKIKRFKILKKEINEYFLDISDILSLK